MWRLIWLADMVALIKETSRVAPSDLLITKSIIHRQHLTAKSLSIEFNEGLAESIKIINFMKNFD